jgi:hypothetical protein
MFLFFAISYLSSIVQLFEVDFFLFHLELWQPITSSSFYELNSGSMLISFIKNCALFYVRTVNKFLNKGNLASCFNSGSMLVSFLNEGPINSNEYHSSTSMLVSMPVLIGDLG